MQFLREFMDADNQVTLNKRSLTVDAVKGVAILLVMFGHVLVWNHMTDGYVYDVIKVVQMPLFIMVSAYLAGAGHHVDGLRSYGKMVGKRAVSYLVPFFVWIILLHPRSVTAYIKLILFDLDEGLWFLMTLFILTLMVYTAELASAVAGRWKTAVFWMVYLGLTALVLIETLMGVEFLSPGLTRLYIPFYIVGFWAGEHKQITDRVPDGVKNVLCVLSWMALIVMAALFDLQNVDTLCFLLRQIAASFIGCYAFIHLTAVMKEGRLKKFLAWLGGYTLEIYVLHFHFAYLLYDGTVYSLYSIEGLAYVLVSFALMSLITAVPIVITKKFRILDLLLYGKTARFPKKRAIGG